MQAAAELRQVQGYDYRGPGAVDVPVRRRRAKASARQTGANAPQPAD